MECGVWVTEETAGQEEGEEERKLEGGVGEGGHGASPTDRYGLIVCRWWRGAGSAPAPTRFTISTLRSQPKPPERHRNGGKCFSKLPLLTQAPDSQQDDHERQNPSDTSLPPFPPDYRASGVLLHVTSLPSPYGIGDVGPAALAWIDRLHEAGQTWWQALPLGPTGYGNSPYQSLSSFAGNGLLISPDLLIEDGLLRRERLRGALLPGDSHRL